MKMEDLEARLNAAEALVVEACEIAEQASLYLYRNEFGEFGRRLRDAVAKLGCATVAFDAIANECARLTLS